MSPPYIPSDQPVGSVTAGIDRLVYRGNAALGVAIGAIADAAGTPYEMGQG